MFRAEAGVVVPRFQPKHFPPDRAPRLKSYRVPLDAGLTLTQWLAHDIVCFRPVSVFSLEHLNHNLSSTCAMQDRCTTDLNPEVFLT